MAGDDHTPDDQRPAARRTVVLCDGAGRPLDTVDLLDAGHWVHVEAGEGVAQVLAARLG